MNITRVMGEVVEVAPVLNDKGEPIMHLHTNINRAVVHMRRLAESRQTFVMEPLL